MFEEFSTRDWILNGVLGQNWLGRPLYETQAFTDLTSLIPHALKNVHLRYIPVGDFEIIFEGNDGNAPITGIFGRLSEFHNDHVDPKGQLFLGESQLVEQPDPFNANCDVDQVIAALQRENIPFERDDTDYGDDIACILSLPNNGIRLEFERITGKRKLAIIRQNKIG